MNEDAAYKQTALRNRGESAQDIAARLLKPVFGEGNVYTEVRIEKAKGQTLTDIDVLAIAGNKAVIVQVKSKRLTELARVGDSERLTADFKAAVQDAYDQGLISRQAVIDRSTKFLAGDKELRLTEGIDDAYILCLTLDHYPAITHQVDVYLNKSKTDPFPVALSVFDLDILAFYLGDPFDFLYYLRQRVRLSPYFKADSEMSLLGFHIKHKLHKSSDVDMEALDQSFAQLIDANFPVLRGSVPKTAAAEKLYPEWKNDEFQGLVRQTKAAASAGFTDAVFFLYDLAGEAADGLIECIKKLKRKSATDHRAHDASLLIAEGRAGISIVIEPSSSSTMRRKLYSLCVLRKHKSKADTWLGLGSLTVSNTLVDSMIFNKDPWQEDPQLNRLADAHLGRTGRARTASGTKIGRNDPCPCGSGNKFKRCHGA